MSAKLKIIKERELLMSEYNQQALEFLNSCPAELEIHYAGTSVNHLWNEKQSRDMYSFVIKTPRGTMHGIFWDSIHNTELRSMTVKQYCAKRKNIPLSDLTYKEQVCVIKEFDEEVKASQPNAYQILACLEKYDVGSMDDFMHEFGYVIKSVKDMTNFITTYNAVVKEYNDLCRIFTPEQMEMLREIY